MKRIWKNVILIGFALVLCVLATGCMGGQKDIKKDEEAAYTEMIAAAAEEFGYEYEQQTVLPKGSALLYVLFNDDERVRLRVTINEESTYDLVSCEFKMGRGLGLYGPEDRIHGFEPHMDVLVKISKHFTDEITKEKLMAFLNSEDNWGEPRNEDEKLYKAQDNMTYSMYLADVIEGEEIYEESFTFSWDNGNKYKLKKDK